MGTKEPAKPGASKNGEWQSKPNPFSQGPTHKAPELAEEAHIGRVFDKVLQSGCAVMLGLTRDGGALCLTILDGTERHRTYCSNDVELSNALAALSDMYDGS